MQKTKSVWFKNFSLNTPITPWKEHLKEASTMTGFQLPWHMERLSKSRDLNFIYWVKTESQMNSKKKKRNLKIQCLLQEEIAL